MIKNLVFDLGNVLINFLPDQWLREKYGEADGTFLMDAFCRSPLWVSLDRGDLTLPEVREKLLALYPERRALLEDCLDNYYGMLTPIPGSVTLLKTLADRGWPLYYLTNYHAGAFQYLLDSCPWFDQFRGGVCSAHEGLVKPEPEIYLHLCRQEGLVPEETLFMDDSKENTAAAAALGFRTLTVDDPDQFPDRVLSLLSLPQRA